MITKFFELSSNLNELLKNSDKYNVIIEVGQEPNDQDLNLYFKNKLDAITYNDNNVKIIKQPNIPIEVFHIIINYNGTVSLETVNISVIFDLLIASSEFGLEELIKHIQLFLLENNSSWLRLNFSLGIAQNPSLPPDLDKWSDEHFLALKNSLQNCLPLIRYFQISGEDIFDKGKIECWGTQKTLTETLTKDNTHSEAVAIYGKADA
ncbi:hypothetical protein C2G38_2193329 [Gigaspora rosea]|uniref:Uncharacterized protein n=1 Tax=Gigaspora rosea TaxID=44941 RepID=A0A397UZ99_9GLOM|nr:hypothetical protein C2G38_2193329 [Gigaspora rosea]